MRFLSAVVYYFLFTSICHADPVLPQVCDLKDCVTVEVVSKQVDMERGLMNRTHLDQNKGMLFVFSIDDRHSFWMKNTLLNLDMLWISFDGRIVFISHDVPACTKDPCTVYTPNEASRYVLEVNSGYTVSHHWKLGDRIYLKGIQ